MAKGRRQEDVDGRKGDVEGRMGKRAARAAMRPNCGKVVSVKQWSDRIRRSGSWAEGQSSRTSVHKMLADSADIGENQDKLIWGGLLAPDARKGSAKDGNPRKES